MSAARGVASETFWTFFLSLHTQSAVAINAALRAAKLTFLQDENTSANTGVKTTFLASKRTLLTRIKKITPQFWPGVTHTVRFDLAELDLPNKKFTFRFINPIWGWLMAVRRLDQQELVWTPTKQVDRVSRKRVYGGGVQYGESFTAAYNSCPVGTSPMGVSLHWDGTSAHGVHSTPIAVGVANVNGQTERSHTCIGYMPVLTGMGKQFQDSDKSTEVKHLIRQTCIAAILTILEEGAVRGVRCVLTVNGWSVNVCCMCCVNVWYRCSLKVWYGWYVNVCYRCSVNVCFGWSVNVCYNRSVVCKRVLQTFCKRVLRSISRLCHTQV